VEDETVYLMVDRKKREKKGPGTRYILQGHTPSEPLLPARPQLLKFLPPPKIAPSIRDQALNT
jgi:hypothetical protein